MKYFSIILLVLCSNIFYAQSKIDSESWLLGVNDDENYVVYFKATNNDPDEYIEGNIFVYDVENKSHDKLNSEVYILDFTSLKFIDSNSFYLNTGSKIEKYHCTNKKSSVIFESTEKQWVKSIDLSNDRNCLIIVVEEEIKAQSLQKMVLFDLKDEKVIDEIYEQEVTENNESDIIQGKLDEKNKLVYIKDSHNNLFKYHLESNKKIKIDTDLIWLLKMNKQNLYYLKSNTIVSYNIDTGEKTDIIKSDNLSLSFFDTYKHKLFLCLNDNIFIYDNKNETFDNLEQLGKKNFVFFGKKIALEHNEENNKTLNIYYNSN